MAGTLAGRVAYRVKQFAWAVAAWWDKPSAEQLELARPWLPEEGWRLFLSMPPVDQAHALKVLEATQAAGYSDPALAQAALLHDAAKRTGGVTIAHRVAVVLIKVLAREWWEEFKGVPAPMRTSLLYPLWAHGNHPFTGAELAQQAGCAAEAVELIKRHQDPLPPESRRTRQEELLAALQKADDDN